jgi:hypothetical protein
MRIRECHGLMTSKTQARFLFFKNDVGCVLAILNFVAGDAPAFHRGMGVITHGAIGMTLQAIGIFGHRKRMFSCIEI